MAESVFKVDYILGDLVELAPANGSRERSHVSKIEKLYNAGDSIFFRLGGHKIVEELEKLLHRDLPVMAGNSKAKDSMGRLPRRNNRTPRVPGRVGALPL